MKVTRPTSGLAGGPKKAEPDGSNSPAAKPPLPPVYFPHDRRNSFIQPPDYRPLPDGVIWESVKEMIYVDPWGKIITVPKGFHSDFASIPDLSRIALYVQVIAFTVAIWWSPAWIVVALATWVIYIAESFLHEGTWDSSSFLHDWMYATRCRTFWQANWILLVSMKAQGGALTPSWKRYIIFFGVAVGGYVAWIDDARKLANRKNEAFAKSTTHKIIK